MKLLKGVALLLSLVILATPARSEQPLLLFAAASLKEVVDAAAAAFGEETGTGNRAVYAASSTLARQIEAGAPADIYISANKTWMTYLDKKGAVDSASIISIATNSLVVVAAAPGELDNAQLSLDILAERLSGQTIALADPAHVPAGIYAKQALTALKIWPNVEKQAVRAANVRDALAFVARDEVPYAIVYSSDALAEPRVVAIAELPSDLHDRIDYSAAQIAGSGSRVQASEFLDFLLSSQGQAIFADFGFGPRLREH